MAHLASEEHLCNSIGVPVLLEQVIVDNEIGEPKLEQSHVVRGSFLLYRLLFVLVFEHLSGIAQLALKWHFLDMFFRNCLILNCIITLFIRGTRLRDRVLLSDRFWYGNFCFGLFDYLLLRFLYNDTHPDFLPKLLSFRHQPEVAHIVARL